MSYVDVLSGFESVLKIIEVFRNKGSLMNSALLKRITQSNAPIADVNDPQATLSPIGKFPYEKAKELLLYFRSIFDEKQAKRDGNIKPLPGVDADYDQAKADIANIESSLQAYLKEMKKVTNIPEIVYWGSNKDRYQLEVPISKSSRVPSDWNTKSQKKTHRRYWTPVIEDLFDKLQHAEVRMASAQKDTMRRIFEKFDSNITTWTLGVNCISILDALLSLALVSSNPEYVWPVMIQKTEQIKPFIHIENGRHPMLEQALSGK